MGFALAYAALFFVSYLGADADPVPLGNNGVRLRGIYGERLRKREGTYSVNKRSDV